MDGTLTRLCPPSDNGEVVSRYTDNVEENHAYIKETVDTVFPSSIRLLQVRLRSHSGTVSLHTLTSR